MKLWCKVQKAKMAIKYQKAKKEAFKLSFAVVVAEVVMVGIYVLAVNSGIMQWFEHKTVYIEIAKADTKELKDTKEDLNVNKIIDYIHFKESTNGTAKVGLNKTCELKGLSNEYGYNPPACYNNNETVIQLIKDFIKNKTAQGFNERELLCIYNTGKSQNGVCNYVKEFE